MYKKIIVLICTLFLVGCTSTNINKLTLEEIIDNEIKEENNYTNVNNKGYKYYLPKEFNVSENNNYIQVLSSNNNRYYMNINLVSYHYKNIIASTHDVDDYEYYEFENNDKKGYLKIEKDGDDFFVELCYNYAIIEVEVKESELRYAISRSIEILSSIKYNDLVIEKYIVDNNIDESETIYKIPEPENKEDKKNVLEYIEEQEKSSN